MNKETFEKLQYNELKEKLKSYCVSGLGRELIDKLEPSRNIKVVKRRLEETKEARTLLDITGYVPLQGIHNVNMLLDSIQKGIVLTGEELITISDFLRGCRKVKEYMKDKEGYAPILNSYSSNIGEFLWIEEDINYSIKGNRVDSNATKELKKIRKSIDICEGKIEEKLNKFLKNSENKKFIQEFFISKRNDRFTIPIKAAYKNVVNGSIVPLNFEVGRDYRSLIITGPNAGGKTVVLKTVGLLTLAVQSGLHISVKEGSEISVFNKIYVDIGDNQSIENALSTFSSHVKNLSAIIRESGKSTLLLFDEIGSGTEPNEGAALAIAILEELYHKGCITIATTHYGEIKNFSQKHDDFENAAMMFKKDTLEPLYRLQIGKSGDSNALWISKKMGIDDRILNKAKRYMEDKNYSLEKVKESKVSKDIISEEEEIKNIYNYSIGDKVLLLDYNDYGIIYKERDEFNNIEVFYKNEFIKVNERRIKLSITAEELYPEGYDLTSIFIEYSERKLEHDIERGSKKALREIKKSMK
ncbi:MutS-related protein [Clostridium sardiniense]|uniref:MutS-related protein n=1 Tax=Clostridium sardiniense TaxID=29369 RepID=UPI00195C2222|nr:endonuclease MutS2 [Clostridium sardiniense]MBM7836371.1 dsDNA-specific endonuclease/ATPase MutS2 [Clostridium sardiniense]